MTDNNVREVEVMASVNATDVGLPPDSRVASKKNKSSYWKRLVWTPGQGACWSVLGQDKEHQFAPSGCSTPYVSASLMDQGLSENDKAQKVAFRFLNKIHNNIQNIQFLQ